MYSLTVSSSRGDFTTTVPTTGSLRGIWRHVTGSVQARQGIAVTLANPETGSKAEFAAKALPLQSDSVLDWLIYIVEACDAGHDQRLERFAPVGEEG